MIALDAKNSDRKKLNDISPIFDPSIKLSTKFIRPVLYVLAGTISTIKVCNCVFIPFFEIKGRLGIKVKRNRHVAGTDIIKLYEIAAALSVRLGILKRLLKKLTTS